MSDREEIDQLIADFISAMHEWEKRCLPHMRKLVKGQLDSDETVELELSWLQEVFKEHCIEWKSPGRGATYGDPPDYDPAASEVQKIEVDGDQAVASVLHKSELLGDEIVQYFALRIDKAWKLEDRRRHLKLSGEVIQEWNTL